MITTLVHISRVTKFVLCISHYKFTVADITEDSFVCLLLTIEPMVLKKDKDKHNYHRSHSDDVCS